MNEHQSKTIATAVIWIATAALFIFGVFRFNWNGLPAGVLWTFVACILAISPAIATKAIWNSEPRRKDDDSNPPKS